jgi:hypothetical protein
MNAGIACAVLAYVLWGVFPVYFKALQHVAATGILAHRMVWSLAFVAAVLALRRRWDWLREVLERPALVGRFAATAALVSVNRGVYIWVCCARPHRSARPKGSRSKPRCSLRSRSPISSGSAQSIGARSSTARRRCAGCLPPPAR